MWVCPGSRGPMVHNVDMNDGTGIGDDRGVANIFAGNRIRSYGRKGFNPLMASRVNVQVIYRAWVSKIKFANNRALNVTLSVWPEIFLQP